MTTPFPPVPGAVANLRGLKLVATTGLAGFALQNATPTILTWTAPNDGQLHRILVFGELHTTQAATGGQANTSFTTPDGTVKTSTLNSGSNGVGVQPFNAVPVLVQPGATVTVLQQTALTAGAVVLFAEIWAL